MNRIHTRRATHDAPCACHPDNTDRIRGALTARLARTEHYLANAPKGRAAEFAIARAEARAETLRWALAMFEVEQHP